MSQKTNHTSAFASMVLLFFLWGFITELDGALIPYLKGLFELNNFQAALVQFAFFIAFFVMSLPSAWILNKIGYQKGIVLGLVIMAVGSWLFYPAADVQVYALFLAAVFVLASGVTLLQVAANPYVSRLGSPDGASSRLNLAQGFNSIAKVLAPLFGSYFILRGLEGLGKSEQAQAVQTPYLILGGILFLMAIVFLFIKLPEVVNRDEEETTSQISEAEEKTSALQFPQLRWGIGAIFLYVGAEVAIATFLVIFLSEDVFPQLEKYQAMVTDLSSKEDITARFREIGARFLPFYWGGLMIGRLLGSWLLKYMSASKMLAGGAIKCMVLILIFLFSEGYVAMWSLIATGLFLSIMWSNIFTLSIAGLGKHTSQGSGFLIAAIVGGAFIPLLQGALADSSIGMQWSFGVVLLCLGYILWFAQKSRGWGKI